MEVICESMTFWTSENFDNKCLWTLYNDSRGEEKKRQIEDVEENIKSSQLQRPLPIQLRKLFK